MNDEREFCDACQEATGGVCQAHREPECTCYEMFGTGHQPGCDFHGRPKTSDLEAAVNRARGGPPPGLGR